MFTAIHPVSWPSTASLPSVVNMIDASKLSEDFFAKSSQGSPTIIFQKLLLYISYISENNPINAMVFIGSIVSFLYFPFFFLLTKKGLENIVLQWSVNEHLKRSMLTLSLASTFFVFIAISLMQNDVNNRFTNMMWPPILLNPNAYIVSMLLCISGALVSIKNRYFCICLIGISCLLHPAMSLFTAMFCFLLLNDFSSKIITLNNASAFFIPILLVYIFLFIYYPQAGMSAHDFIDIYIYQRHPHHYLISASFQKKQWIIILLMLSAETGMLMLLRNKVWINSLFAFSFLAIIPPIQYLFTEIYQIKAIAIFGFPRFFTFAFYLVIFFGLAAFISMLRLVIQHSNRLCKLTGMCEHFLFSNRIVPIVSAIILLVATFLLVNYVHRELIYTDHSIKEFNSKYQDILYKIPDSSVVMMLDEDDFHFGLFGKKNLYSTEAFPFSESKFYEYAKRRMIFDDCSKNLSPTSIAEAKKHYKLNFLIIKRERLSKLPGANPIAESDNLVLIDVDDYLGEARNPKVQP